MVCWGISQNESTNRLYSVDEEFGDESMEIASPVDVQ